MFACILLPNFHLQATLRWRDHAGSAAVVHEGALVEVNDPARAHGITPGLTSPQAMARDGKVLILLRSPAQEACLNDLLLGAALDLSPDVELTAPGAATADLTHAPRGTCWQQLADQIIIRFQELSLQALVGIAATPDLAHLAAQSATPSAIVYDASAFASPLPVEVLRPSENLSFILRDWGIRTVGEFLRLPKAGAIERLGSEAQNLLSLVSGRNRRPLCLVRTPPDYSAAFDFDYIVETTEPLLFLLRRFLDELTARLRSVFRVARQMTLSIPLDNDTTHERAFCIPSPTADVEVLFRILHTYLETLQLSQHPVGVRLKLDAIAPPRDQLRLFESALRDPNLFGETLARLKALLGNDRVGVPACADTHQPDRFTLRPIFETPTTTSSPDRRGLPLRRYRPAPSARVTLLEDHPITLSSEPASGTISNFSGPFHLSGNWWDSTRWAVEEWDVELDDGTIYRIARRSRHWTVEGCYELR